MLYLFSTIRLYFSLKGAYDYTFENEHIKDSACKQKYIPPR